MKVLVASGLQAVFQKVPVAMLEEADDFCLGLEIVKRVESAISALKLSEMLRVPLATVTTWERGHSIPDPAQLALISKLLGGGFHCTPTVE